LTTFRGSANKKIDHLIIQTLYANVCRQKATGGKDMYEMVDKEYIRKRHFVDGWSIREISRSLKISRQTVRKMLKDTEIPKYQQQKPRPCPVMDRWKPIIEAWLQEDQLAPRKQRHTAARIYERLREEYPDFQAAESSVRRWVAKLRRQTPQAFVPLTADAGEMAEADFGKAVVSSSIYYSDATRPRAFTSGIRVSIT
jgi:transposase